MFFLPLPDRKLASKGVFVIFIGLTFLPRLWWGTGQKRRERGNDAPVPAAFWIRKMSNLPVGLGKSFHVKCQVSGEES